MLVKNWMSTSVITIDENRSMQDAVNVLKENNIQILPVMKKEKLVGIVTDRDLKRASASDATLLDVHELIYLMAKIKVKHLMTKNPITVPIDFTVEETAEVLLSNKISGLPVLDHERKLVGVITQADLFKAMIALTGIGKKGIQFAFQLEDRPGSIKEIADIIRKYGARMVSILTTYEGVPDGYRKVYIRVYQVNRNKLADFKKELQEKATMLYMVDHRENRREIY
ncbi:MAG: CBS domain-containing protein [Deltaproteobacteria bacterium]|nr:CBS domain-containing protein [Deltaproteobacteria bacterium]MBW2540078.1 CBS domain-containing protein [Deltaproteobacteria bacterium]